MEIAVDVFTTQEGDGQKSYFLVGWLFVVQIQIRMVFDFFLELLVGHGTGVNPRLIVVPGRRFMVQKTMNDKSTPKKPDPARMQVLRSLPIEVKQQLTKEEADAFLYDDVWPDSLYDKLKDFLAEEED